MHVWGKYVIQAQLNRTRPDVILFPFQGRGKGFLGKHISSSVSGKAALINKHHNMILCPGSIC